MKMLIVAMLFGAAPLFAQSLPTVSGTAQDPVSLAQSAVAAIPPGKWAGKLDLSLDFTVGGWQSLKSADQAYGVSKKFWSLQKGGNVLVNVGFFAGVQKPLVPLASSPLRFLGGDVIQVPGSTLDWALGTNWGSQWAPKLKTGILFAHDLSRLAKTHLFGDFIGIGAAYPI